MARSGIVDDIRTCVKLGVPAELPCFLISEEFDMRMAGVSVEDYTYNPDAVARVHNEAIERFDSEWAGIFVDDLFEIEPLGVGVVGGKETPLAVKEYLPATGASLAKLKVPNPQKDGRMPLFLEALSKIKSTWGDRVAVGGSLAAPFTAVSLLYGIPATMMLTYDDPQLLRDTMEFFVEVETAFGLAQFEAGADTLWFGDCSASSNFISLDFYREYVLEPAQRVIEAYRRTDGIVIYFASETRIPHMKLMAEMGADIVGLGENADLVEAQKAVGDRVCIMGNLAPITVMMNGTVEDVVKASRYIVSNVSINGGHIFNSGEGVPAQVSSEKVEAVFRTVRDTWKQLRAEE